MKDILILYVLLIISQINSSIQENTGGFKIQILPSPLSGFQELLQSANGDGWFAPKNVPSTSGASRSYYKFLQSQVNERVKFSWVDAYQYCLSQGEGAILPVLEDDLEVRWLVQMLGKLSDSVEKVNRSLLIPLNAHPFMYNVSLVQKYKQYALDRQKNKDNDKLANKEEYWIPKMPLPSWANGQQVNVNSSIHNGLNFKNTNWKNSTDPLCYYLTTSGNLSDGGYDNYKCYDSFLSTIVCKKGRNNTLSLSSGQGYSPELIRPVHCTKCNSNATLKLQSKPDQSWLQKVVNSSLTRYYWFEPPSKVTWFDAFHACRSKGGDLLYIEEEEEFEDVRLMFKNFAKDKKLKLSDENAENLHAYMGAHTYWFGKSSSNESKWSWIGGEAVKQSVMMAQDLSRDKQCLVLWNQGKQLRPWSCINFAKEEVEEDDDEKEDEDKQKTGLNPEQISYICKANLWTDRITCKDKCGNFSVLAPKVGSLSFVVAASAPMFGANLWIPYQFLPLIITCLLLSFKF